MASTSGGNASLDISQQIFSVTATMGPETAPERVQVGVRYTDVSEIGRGSFGMVFRARLLAPASNANEMVAIKKVLQDRRFKVQFLFFSHKIAKN